MAAMARRVAVVLAAVSVSGWLPPAARPPLRRSTPRRLATSATGGGGGSDSSDSKWSTPEYQGPYAIRGYSCESHAGLSEAMRDLTVRVQVGERWHI